MKRHSEKQNIRLPIANQLVTPPRNKGMRSIPPLRKGGQGGSGEHVLSAPTARLIGRDEKLSEEVSMPGMRHNSLTRPPLPKGGKSMKLNSALNMRRTRGLTPPARLATRQGSVLIVVIGLLLLLMLIGFAFFTFANQEHSSAEYYADASKEYSPTVPFEWALEQLIIGPRENNTQSALYPGKHSLVPNMLGLFAPNPVGNGYPTVPTDKHSFNGGFGINVIAGPGGQPYIDQNFDGMPDNGNGYLLTLNFSGAAQQSGKGTVQAASRTAVFQNFPALDVGYTYPDINNAFLAYIATEPFSGLQIVTPSFHRPFLLRDPTTGKPNTVWQDDPSGTTDTSTKVLRPHRSHVVVGTNIPRFLSSAVTVGGTNPHTIQYFGYRKLDVNGNPSPPPFNSSKIDTNTTYGDQGLWDNSGTTYEYDVDNDQDGTFEGIWLDLGYPVQVLLDGRKMVPLFSYTAVEADSLINLNTAGNQSWMPQSTGLSRPLYGAPPGYPAVTPPGYSAGSPYPISHSNMGLSMPSEINPFWALIADPRNTTFLSPTNVNANGPNFNLQQYRGFFGLSNLISSSTSAPGYDMNWVEAANMDMTRLFWGAPKYIVTGGGNVQESFTIDDIIAGRWGDPDSLLYGQSLGNINTPTNPTNNPSPPPLYDPLYGSPSFPNGYPLFPRPGYRLFDDDGDLFAGLTDAGYYYTTPANVANAALNYNFNAVGGDPTNYQMPYYSGGVLQPITGSFFANTMNVNIGLPAQLFPTIFAANPGYQSPITVLPFAQPLDFTGAGTWTNLGTYGLIANLIQPSTNQNLSAGGLYPATYLGYNGYQGWVPNPNANPPTGVLSSPVISYQFAFSGSTTNSPPYLSTQTPATLPSGTYPLTTNPINGGLLDEPDEMVTLPAYSQSSDQYFTTDETAALQLRTPADYAAIGGTSRVRQLASWNFELNSQAAQIRQRFTTISSDRRNHSLAADVTTASGANGNRAWEYSTGNNVVVQANWDGNGSSTAPQFPPMVLGYSLDNYAPANYDNPYAKAANAKQTTAAEPFRMELAALIGATLHNSPWNSLNDAFRTGPFEYRSNTVPRVTPWNQQLRLNINRFLTVANPAINFGTSPQLNQQNPLQYRELTPHPTNSEWTNWATTNSTNAGAAIPLALPTGLFVTDQANFASDPRIQEYWARRDRQQMARDLYVMLYMFGGGQDTSAGANTPVNYAGTSNKSNAVYQLWQCAEMAQFAVNVVDSLDRDDTITMFEYDTDLSDGWNLDDNPLTNDSANVDRQWVYGVEAQQLAFNEALVIASLRVIKAGSPENHQGTFLDDQFNDRTYTYLELYNVSPNAVPVNGQNWQIMVLSAASANNINVQPATDAVTVLTFNDTNNVSIAAGQPYTIGSRTTSSSAASPPDYDGTNTWLGSQFIVDTTMVGSTDTNLAVGSGNLKSYYKVPANPTGGGILNLDLTASALKFGSGSTPSDQNQPFILTKAGGSGPGSGDTVVGDFCDLAAGNPTITTASPFTIGGSLYVTTFALRRRLNLARPAPRILSDTNYNTDDADNPYVEVDRISYLNNKTTPGNPVAGNASQGGWFFNPLDPGSVAGGMPGVSDLALRLQLLPSRERKQPFDGSEGSTGKLGAVTQFPGGTPTAAKSMTIQDRTAYYQTSSNTMNTIGTTNNYFTTSGLTAFTLWQPHFDRDFASVMELLSIPLYGPSNATQWLAQADKTNLNSMTTEVPLPVANKSAYLPLVAQAKFLRPQDPSNVGLTPATANYQLDNRWYRVLELLEVPPRANQQVETSLLSQYPWLFPQALQRSPGKIGLNGLRYGENLFALLDDPAIFNLANLGKIPPNTNQPYNPYSFSGSSFVDSYSYYDLKEGNSSTTNIRNWWQQFLTARDQKDITTTYYLPGSPSSRPFRPLSHYDNNLMANSLNSLDDTLLRTLPYDVTSGNTSGSTDKRGLFEARTQNDLVSVNAASGNTVDYYTRQRLLSKIAGNTTPRSNVFLVWVTIGFFEGYQPGANPNVIQIGAEMQDQPRRRGFFVIDRSQLEEAWVVPDPKNPNSGYFDYSRFVQYRKTLQ